MASLRVLAFALPTLSLLGPLAWSTPARACGGTFCDNLPQPMPVDQRGEDILFVMDGSTVEVHVRIEYTGEAQRFAWVLPLQAIPEVAVGSDPLFTALSNAVAPSWTTQTQYDCPEDDPSWGDPGTGDSGGVKFDAGSNDTDGGPDVVFQETVGAFEVVVLQGGTAQEVIDFLDANDYAQDPASEPILQEYLDEGFLFAAVKLTAGADVDQIHPLAFRFQGTEPCVPIRLTRIAAEDDMGIRAYFLAQDRWAPSNYDHVVINPLAYNWQNDGTSQYLETLSMAVDEADGGRGFVTEYAGGSDIVSQSGIFSPAWDETAFIGVDPIVAIQIIDDQGLNTHPLIRSLLMEFIPPPDGEDPQFFWNNIDQFADQIDLMAWDDMAFAAAVLERIIEPGFRATEMLDTWPKLTRLHTTMSPGEMMVDPMFHANDTLPDVAGHEVTTVEQVMCGGDRVVHVDVDGEDWPVCVPEGGMYPGWVDMPFALRIEQVPMTGPAQVGVDNAGVILTAYEAYQNGVTCEADGSGTESGGDGDGDGDPTGGGSGPGADGDESTGEAPYDLPYDTSCGCSTRDGTAPVGVALGVLVLGVIGPWRRRD